MSPTTPQVWVVVVAAGAGTRFGRPKQFEVLGGRRVVDRAVEAARSVADGVVLVLPDAPGGSPPAEGFPGADAVVAGGDTRSASVRAGLAAVPEAAGVVVIHDAARPLAGPALFRSVVDAVRRGADGALPGVAPSDTVKRVGAGGVVEETLDRSRLVLVQTPQAFRAGPIRAAHAAGGEATDDAALVEAGGGRVVVVPGDPRNIKLTGPADLAVAEALLAAGSR